MGTDVVEECCDLKEHIKSTRDAIGEFKPTPLYFPDGDFLSVFFSDNLCYARRLDDTVTVYFDDDSGQLIGCKIKGVSQLVQNIVSLFDIRDENVQIQLLLVSAVGPQIPKEGFYELSQKLHGMTFDPREILRRQAA